MVICDKIDHCLIVLSALMTYLLLNFFNIYAVCKVFQIVIHLTRKHIHVSGSEHQARAGQGGKHL